MRLEKSLVNVGGAGRARTGDDRIMRSQFSQRGNISTSFYDDIVEEFIDQLHPVRLEVRLLLLSAGGHKWAEDICARQFQIE